MVQPGSDGLRTLREFHPKFTYPIFGEAEQIFGYKGLSIGIQFAAHDGSPHVQISYEQKFPQVKSTAALDLNKTLKEFLPASAFQQGFQERLQDDTAAKDWRPPGDLVRSYSKKGRDYEVWAGSLLDPRVNALVNNIQIFVLFFIEAGSYLNLDEVDWSLDRWRVYFVYEKTNPSNPNASPYAFIGYATTYRFYRFTAPRPRPTKTSLAAFPNVETISPKQIPSRLRISQFLILPPFQSSGHGSQLYQAIYNEAIADPTIPELTVEDPSEEFDRLRDACDWKVLEPQLRSATVQISPPAPGTTKRFRKVPTSTLLPVDKLKQIRIGNKIASRQFARQIELFLLSLVPFSHRATGGASLTKLKIQKHNSKDADDRTYYWWRILLKQRIFRKNKDVLKSMEMEEMLTKIEDSARGQEDEYEGLLMLFALRQADKEGLAGSASIRANGDDEPMSSGQSSSRKRKVIEDDDDEEDEEEMEEVEMPKRMKA